MSIITAFDYYFEMILADSEELKQEVYKLRHQVYCQEKHFITPRADGLEYDQYDERASHYLIKYRQTEEYMATTRLILPDKTRPDILFPIEEYCQIDNDALLKTINRQHLAELSRFCISKDFRRRENERDQLITNVVNENRKEYNSPNLTLALLACAMRISVTHDIHYWYALMEPSLKRIFATLGVNFIQLGAITESPHYHGERAPYVIKLTDLLHDVTAKNSDYWNMLTDSGKYIIRT
ncbi:hypothetical protein DOJK_00491 [Patescibacteria group bacterium]|nr:hypothetical protein DOJK_00491 [Patescibacteria group bacterium]